MRVTTTEGGRSRLKLPPQKESPAVAGRFETLLRGTLGRRSRANVVFYAAHTFNITRRMAYVVQQCPVSDPKRTYPLRRGSSAIDPRLDILSVSLQQPGKRFSSSTDSTALWIRTCMPTTHVAST
jgi:hypothetical protein